MGFRFRKSVNIGPFRVNASKSGLGWSVGVPGARYTKMANGRTRTTASIPGTGISWVEESKKRPVKPTYVRYRRNWMDRLVDKIDRQPMPWRVFWYILFTLGVFAIILGIGVLIFYMIKWILFLTIGGLAAGATGGKR